MDETHIKISGQWQYLYRAVDRDGDTVDFYSLPRGIWLWPGGSWSAPSTCTTY